MNHIRACLLANLLADFKAFEDRLPEYLNDHCLLFINRLEKVLKIEGHAFEEDRIKNLKLREIYRLEEKIPRAIFHLTTKNLIVPRMDILDIIYITTK